MKGIEVEERHILITGRPGVGKTTLIRTIAESLRHLRPVGFYTEEMRERGIRKGFELISLDGRRGLLAHTDIKSPDRVGKYRVDVKGFEAFLSSIPLLHPSTRLIIIDEIGKMECLSERFKEVLIQCLNSEKRVVATIALKGSRFIEAIKTRQDIALLEISESNRTTLFADILKEIEEDV